MTGICYSPVTPSVVEDLKRLIGASNVTADLEKRRAYSLDEVPRFCWDEDYVAEAVVFPETVEHVSAVMGYANGHLIPVTPRGAGTGLSGGAVPFRGGLVMSFEKMHRILELDKANLTITVEPGVVTADITRAAQKEGLPIEPILTRDNDTKLPPKSCDLVFICRAERLGEAPIAAAWAALDAVWG